MTSSKRNKKNGKSPLKTFIWIIIGIVVIVGGAWWYISSHKGAALQKTIEFADEGLTFAPLSDETREQFGVVQDLANAMLAQDDVTRRYFIHLLNNLELRPGGGFLGQYAILEIKNGEIISFEVKDTNLLDNSYKSDRLLPEKLQQYLSDTKKMKLRDSNYSPHFPENVADAKHFYALAGEDADFDGVFAINTTLFEEVLKITGPIKSEVGHFEDHGEFSADGGLMKLQRVVEEPVFRADERKACEKALKKLNVPKEDARWKDCQYDEEGKKMRKMDHGERAARKNILDALMAEMIPKLVKLENIAPFITMLTTNLDNKNIQLWFKDEGLQQIAHDAGWTNEVDEEWDGDYVMISDANVGALKSDHFMKRAMEYKVDFTGRSAEANDVNAGRMVRYIGDEIKDQVMAGTFVTNKPLATARMTYENTATEPSYFNSDYHSFTRLFVPQGSKWYVREWFEPPGTDLDYLGKQVYGYKFDVLLGDTIPTMLQYTLPDTITEDGYKLKIQKQSGIGNIPLKVTVITSDGKKHTKELEFVKDTTFELQDSESGKELVIVE